MGEYVQALVNAFYENNSDVVEDMEFHTDWKQSATWWTICRGSSSMEACGTLLRTSTLSSTQDLHPTLLEFLTSEYQLRRERQPKRVSWKLCQHEGRLTLEQPRPRFSATTQKTRSTFRRRQVGSLGKSG